MSATLLPLVFCDGVSVGAMTGTGESVQLTFKSSIAEATGVVEEPVFRVAMTKLAFLTLVETLNGFAKDLTGLDAEVVKRAN